MTSHITKLDSGLRVITDTVPSVESVSVGVWVDVGTRNEEMAHNGVAHMVEHMLFNGTPTRSSLEIAEAIESVGGQINAYTGRETTAYYVHLLKEDTRLALDILSDMIQRASFQDKELEKERGVIVQEIGMSNDTPDDIIFDHYQETAYPDQALGAPILGRTDIIESMKKETLREYVRRFYTPSNMVVSAAGNIAHDDMVRYAMELFGDLPADAKTVSQAARYEGGDVRHEKDLEQAHVVLGFQGISRFDPEYYAAVLLATILGGGMSSRLFQEIREKRGLVYSIYGSHTSYHDDGQFEIYAGTGGDKLPELVPVVCDELMKIIQEPVAADELARAQSQLRASILMSRESMMSRSNRQAKYLLHFGEGPDINHLIERIYTITPDTLQAMAQRIFSGKPTLAALGPLSHLEEYERVATRLAA